jgi:predicted DNA-binding transcriptional regulator AlpA
MSGKQAKKIRREARSQPVDSWVDEIPHPLDGESRTVEVIEPPRKKEAAPSPLVALAESLSTPVGRSNMPVLLTLKDVAARLNISPRTVQRMEKDHGLPGRVNFGGIVRYHWEFIEKWLSDKAKK